jgi:hypothetical protein
MQTKFGQYFTNQSAKYFVIARNGRYILILPNSGVEAKNKPDFLRQLRSIFSNPGIIFLQMTFADISFLI